MRIAYVAKHDSGGNDDEGAITHALTELGHDVQRLREERGHKVGNINPDLILFHKWDDPATLDRMGLTCPRVTWWFDLVDWPGDPSLRIRCQTRRAWMERVLPHVDLAFMSDGDWADRVNDGTVCAGCKGKAVFLPQGADERVMGFGIRQTEVRHPILFTGIRAGGRGRASFVDEMESRWGDRFHQVRRGTHGRAMADLIASSDVVVCPDSPVTDRYCSNRLWNAMGFGALLLHPRCKFAEEMVGQGIVEWYGSRDELHSRLDEMLAMDIPHQIARRAITMSLAMEHHTYRHRCATLIRVVKERFHV